MRAVRAAALCSAPWSGTALWLLAVVSACSTEGAMSLRPEVDVGTHTAAVTAPASTASYDFAPTAPVAEASPAEPASTLDMQAAALSAAATPVDVYPPSDADLAPVAPGEVVEETEVAALPAAIARPGPDLAPAAAEPAAQCDRALGSKARRLSAPRPA